MKTQPRVGAVLLAAGRGTRFGGDKLVQPMPDGVPIAVHAARHMMEAGLQVTAVVRPADERLASLLTAEGCEVTVCADAAAGMGHSLAHGVRHAGTAAGWIVALGDMPGVRPDTIVRLVQAVVGGAAIAAPTYRGKRGHPVAFAARHYAALTALSGDEGARSVVQRHAAELVLVECDDPGVLYDVDRPSDLERQV